MPTFFKSQAFILSSRQLDIIVFSLSDSLTGHQ